MVSRMRAPFVACALMFVVACGASDPPAQDPSDASTDLGTATDGPATVDARADGASDGVAPPPDASSLVDDLLAKVATCKQVSAGKFKTDDQTNLPENIPICGLVGAVFWQADMDIDCDGKTTAQCNSTTDPSYQNQTAATDSQGNPLDAAALPYVVIPSNGTRFNYTNAGLKMGSVVLVIYGGKIEYGILGDTGPTNIIGEASYAMAKNLGINPDPKVGGVDKGVTYIAFTGTAAVVKKKEDHAEAVTLGGTLTADLLKNN